MKIAAVLGSPRRKGNSSGMCEALTGILAENGHEVTTHHLNGLSYRGCQACEGCKVRSDFCVLLDDLTPVLKDVKESDIVILASPVYWGEVSAQMKGFIDRTYSYLTPDFIEGPVRHRFEKGKKLVFILSQGGDEAMYEDIFPRYNTFYQQLEMFEQSYLIRGCELSDRDDFRSRPDLLERIQAVASELG